MKISDFTNALESKYGISIEDTSTRRLTESVDCSTLECKISKILKANGYKADPKYVSAAADYIEMSNEMGDPYTVEQWFKDTEMNYPEDLELEESCKKSLSEKIDESLYDAYLKAIKEEENNPNADMLASDILKLLDSKETGWNNYVAEWAEDFNLDEEAARKIMVSALRNYIELDESCKKSLSESADTRPNHMKIIDLIEDGLIDYKFIAEELLRWMPDDKLGELINIYDLDYEPDGLEESKGNPVDKRAEYKDYIDKGLKDSNIYDDVFKHPRKGVKKDRYGVPDVVRKSAADAGYARQKLKKDFDDYKEFKNRNQVREFAKSRKG